MQPGRVLLTNVPNANQPLLMQPTLTGPNARAPTVFPQNLSVVPQAIPQQLIGQNPPGAGLPPIFFPQQPQYAATNQPINLGNPAAQLGATNAPQQIPGGIHTMPHMMASVNTAAGTMNQVPPTSTTNYRGMSMPQTSRPPSTQGKRQSKAIKIIDPSTNMEVSMGDSKPETPQPPPALMQPDTPTTTATLPSVGAPVTTGATAPFNAPPTGHVTGGGGGGGGGSVAQDFKRRVHESNTTGAVNAQGSAMTATIPTASVQKPPPPNAIITDPNNKAGAGVGGVGGGVLNKIGVSEPASSSKTRFDAHIEVSTQQPRSLLGSQPSTSATVTAPTVSEADQKKRDEFRQKILQSVNQTTSTTVAVGDEGKAAAQEEVPVEVKNGGQESSVASQNVGENNQKEGLLPLPLPTPRPQATSAPLKASPDEPSVNLVGESERTAPSEDKIAPVPSVPDTQATTTTNGSEQADASPSDIQTDVQSAPVESVQPEKVENGETNSREVKDDVSPPVPSPNPPPPPPSTEEAALPPEKIEGVPVPEKGTEEESTESIQVADTGSQVIVDSEEAAPPATTGVADEQREVESEVVEEESGGEKKLQEDKEEQQVESSQPPATQEAPEAEPPKPEEVEVKKEEEKPKSEPEQGEKEEPVTKPGAAVPSSAFLVSESPAPARKVKEEIPSAAVPSEAKESERTEVHAPDSSVETKTKVEESKPAVADQKETSISRENEAKEKEVSGEPKEPSQPKKVQEGERSAVVPATTKSAKPEKVHVVDEGKSTPPTKPKEVVKTVEQSVKPEKQDRPASAKPVAAVPASAQLAPGEHLLEYVSETVAIFAYNATCTSIYAWAYLMTTILNFTPQFLA